MRLKYRNRALSLACLVAIAGCVDGAAPTAVHHPGEVSPSLSAQSQRPFAFLAPLGPTEPTAGSFDATANPRVEICGYTGTFTEAACEGPVQQYFVGGKGPRKLAVEANAYEASWRTKPNLDQTRTYRIRVLIGTHVLAHIDAGFDDARSQAGVYYSLTRRETLPIRFWIGEVPRTPPSVQISAPTDQARFVDGDAIQFTGSATDQDGNALTGSALVWTSSEDGELGTGGSIAVDDLSVGEHVITLTATDTRGSFAAASIALVVGPRIVATTIGAGDLFTCALDVRGSAHCWGVNPQGQLGNGTTTFSTRPVAVVGNLSFTALSVGYNHACGITANRDAYCWGRGWDGELGNGGVSNQHTPVKVAGGLQFISISAGFNYTCGVSSNNVGYCWGSNTQNRLGTGDTANPLTPALVAGGLSFRQISTGSITTCGITTGNAAYCWGDNGFGQLGIGTLGGVPTPTAVAGGHQFSTISVGGRSTCALKGGGTAYCWGDNTSGRLGIGTTASYSAWPLEVAGGRAYTAVSVGWSHACATATDNVAYCWGLNQEGQLGDDTRLTRRSPTPVASGVRFTSITASKRDHTCALSTANAGYCWGYNISDLLGTGTGINQLSPAPVLDWPAP